MKYSDDFPDDETLQEQNYKEFKLSALQEKNLKEIEKNVAEGKINSENKEDMLVYLERLYGQINEIKKEESKYEGEENFNINRYLDKIKKLIKEIEKI
jgi:hypothetical protein